ncbi:MAG: cytochrome c biogenesis protein CcsA [Bryobacteraceae bacterium]|nr:cytochrome c biogenesis protein CcsA [Bryobacteraceae bacterium]
MHEFSVFWLRAAAALYAVGLFHTLQIAIRRGRSIFRTALSCFAAGLVLHMVALVENGIATGTVLPGGFSNSVSLWAFFLGMLFLFVYWRYRIESLGVIFFPLVFVMTSAAAIRAPVQTWSSGAARDTWLVVHIALVLLGYAAIVLTAFASVLYLMQERQLKRKKSMMLLERLPPLDILDSLISRSLGFGFALITLGVVTGITWAYIDSQGSQNLVDSRLTTALITWAACLLMVTLRVTAGWRGRRTALMAVAVAVCSAATWAVHYVRH